MPFHIQSSVLKPISNTSDFEFKMDTKKTKASKFYEIPNFKLSQQQFSKASTDKNVYNYIVRKITQSLYQNYEPFFGTKEIHSACTLVVYTHKNLQETTLDTDAFGVDKLVQKVIQCQSNHNRYEKKKLMNLLPKTKSEDVEYRSFIIDDHSSPEASPKRPKLSNTKKNLEHLTFVVRNTNKFKK